MAPASCCAPCRLRLDTPRSSDPNVVNELAAAVTKLCREASAPPAVNGDVDAVCAECAGALPCAERVKALCMEAYREAAAAGVQTSAQFRCHVTLPKTSGAPESRRQQRGRAEAVGDAGAEAPEPTHYSAKQVLKFCVGLALEAELGLAFDVDADTTLHVQIGAAAAESGASRVSVRLENGPLFVAGRYRKLSRRISQSPWPVADEGPGADAAVSAPRSDGSVEECVVAAMRAAFGRGGALLAAHGAPRAAAPHVFSAGGREDQDVRCLGNGRPFLLELRDPCVPRSRATDAHLRAAVDALAASPLGGAVEMRALSYESALYVVDALKVAECAGRKTYRAVVQLGAGDDVTESELARRIAAIPSDLRLQQRTPVRVLHRRTWAVREKRVHRVRLHAMRSGGVAELHLETGAGTYVKEFVHGDLGRTVPNLRTLLGLPRADILELDVTHIEWASACGENKL